MSSGAGDSDDEDLLQFASLMSGSLMKDLLADLQVDEDGGGDAGWLTLEQLERELAALDADPAAPGATPTAASGGSGGNTDLFTPFQQSPPTGGAVGLPPGLSVPPPAAASTAPPQPGLVAPPSMTAASMVVQQQQSVAAQERFLQPKAFDSQTATSTAQQQQDAWILSMQKFSSLGSTLGQDFLDADSAQKQQKQQRKQQKSPAAELKAPPGLDLSLAQEYDVSEPAPATVTAIGVPRPPPGLSAPAEQRQPSGAQQHEAGETLPVPIKEKESAAGTDITTPTSAPTSANDESLCDTVAARLAEEQQVPPSVAAPTVTSTLPPPLRFPKTPQNSMAISPDAAEGVPPEPVAGGGQQRPPSLPPEPMQQQQGPVEIDAPPPHPSSQPPAQPMIPQPSTHQQLAQQQQEQQHMPPAQPMHPVPIAVPVAPGSAAAAPPPPVRPARPVYCNPHPQALPVPASHLASRYMKPRDISYVVHAILKPILQAGSSPSDYDIQLLMRLQRHPPGTVLNPHLGNRRVVPSAGSAGARRDARGGRQATERREQKSDDDDALQREMLSRASKAKEWSQQQHVLGHVSKTNVARPRALIALQGSGGDDGNGGSDSKAALLERKQRAAVWKARIVCDQAYQAYDKLCATAPPVLPPGQQSAETTARARGTWRMKLMKCMGLTASARRSQEQQRRQQEERQRQQQQQPMADDYQVDETVLKLVLKLNKGRALVARVLEQALLPLPAVQALLPALLDALYSTRTASASAALMALAVDPSHIATDDRLFLILARITVGIATSQQSPPCGVADVASAAGTLLQCLRAVWAHSVANSAPALSTVQRMQFAHTLLQTGAGAVLASEDDRLREEWTKMESQFAELLTGM